MSTKLTPVAVTSADLLRAIDAGGWATRAELAERVGRKPNNISRDLSVLENAGLIAINPDTAAPARVTLTGNGKAQLAAIGRAEHGGEPRRVRGRGPFDSFQPNPANRPVTDAAVRATADTIEALGDVVQPVETLRADANGVRMLLDGEHRWRACLLLQAEGRLPAALAEGLKFEEREATAAEQILIRIVTATARADLSPLDDARQLLALQKETGWSAREIAKKTGRSPADSDVGVRDVQVKIRIARDATPEALAAYEADGSWDQLRESVTEKKAVAEPVPDPIPALDIPGGGSAYAAELPVAAATAVPNTADDPDWVLNPPWLADETLEIRVKSDRIQLWPFHHPDGRWYVSISTQLGDGGVGESYGVRPWNPAYPSRLEALKAARKRVLERHPLAPPWARTWLDQQLGPFYVNGIDRLNASNAGEARRAAGLEARKSNSAGGSGKSSLPPAAQAIMKNQRETVPASGPQTDPWGRDHNTIVADQALLRRVTDFTLGNAGADTPGYARQMLASLGLDGPFGADEAGGVLADVVGSLQPRAFAIIDVDSAWPIERANALALLVAWSLNRALNEQAAG